MFLWKRSDAGEAAIALLSPTSTLEENPEARADSHVMAKAFLEARLK